MGNYAETHDDCERMHDRRQRQAGFRAERDLTVVCTRSVGSRRPQVCGKRSQEIYFAVPLWSRGQQRTQGKTPRPHTLGAGADAGASEPVRWPLGMAPPDELSTLFQRLGECKNRIRTGLCTAVRWGTTSAGNGSRPNQSFSGEDGHLD